MNRQWCADGSARCRLRDVRAAACVWLLVAGSLLADELIVLWARVPVF